jgi:hypothetical protein
MFEFGVRWGLATIIGCILLLAAIAYAVTTYRKRGPTSEQSARELYQRAAREEEAKLEETVDSPPLSPADKPWEARRRETARWPHR